MCLYVYLHLHKRDPARLPVHCIAELVQRLSFGLLIPFYSTGIMCYSNPNPIWGVWRWHEDDVTARTRGETENYWPESQLSTRHRLLLAACLNDYIESLRPQQIITVRGTSSQKLRKKKSILTVDDMHFRETVQVLRLDRHIETKLS